MQPIKKNSSPRDTLANDDEKLTIKVDLPSDSSDAHEMNTKTIAFF